jgi:cobalt transporter subunit CbtA
MLTRVLLAAMIAGVLAGIFATGVQTFRVMPLIVAAEQYEGEVAAGTGHDHSADTQAMTTGTGDDHSGHDHGESWKPNDGVERILYTGMANVVVGVAYGLILLASVLVLNQSLNFRSGLVWGFAGFVVFVLAPNFGLPPELPGMPAGELVPRQVWWAATVCLTACGLALFAFKSGWAFMAVGVAMIIAPHVYGAPAPLSHESAVPASLAAEFVVATMVSSLLFWLFLGGLLGVMFERAMAKENAENA